MPSYLISPNPRPFAVSIEVMNICSRKPSFLVRRLYIYILLLPKEGGGIAMNLWLFALATDPQE